MPGQVIQILILLLLEDAKIEPSSWVATFTAVASILAAAIGASYGTYKAIQKIRDNARKAKEAEELAIGKRISEAVEKKETELQSIISMAQQAATHWENMVKLLEKEKQHDRETHAEEKTKLEQERDRIREERNGFIKEIEKKNLKIEQIVDLNLGLQGQVNENAQQIAKLKQRQTASEHRQAISENRQDASESREGERNA